MLATSEARSICRQWTGVKVSHQHIRREYNTWADWLARMARALGRNASLWELTDVAPVGEAAPRDLRPTLTRLSEAQLMAGETVDTSD